jgi:hypothetical protein
LTPEWITELRQEIGRMVQEAVDASPYGFIVAVDRRSTECCSADHDRCPFRGYYVNSFLKSSARPCLCSCHGKDESEWKA